MQTMASTVAFVKMLSRHYNCNVPTANWLQSEGESFIFLHTSYFLHIYTFVHLLNDYFLKFNEMIRVELP